MPASSAGSIGKQRRFIQLIVAAGLVGAVVMSLAMTNTLSAFVATITNSNDTAATGAIVLQETGASGGAACNSTDNNSINNNSFATCATFNKYGGSTTMVPSNAAGTTNNVATTVNFKNTGSGSAATFTMAFGACTSSNNGTVNNGSATDFCSKLRVKVMSGTTTVVPETTAASLALAANSTVNIPAGLIPAANSGTTVPFTFTTYVDNSAGNTYQGLQASQPITWTLSS